MKYIDFLGNLEQLRFTGQLVYADPSDTQWTFYLFQGRIVYATGGVHPVRRWRRNLITYCPRIPTYRLAWQIDLSKVNTDELGFGWEYALLNLWVIQKRITQTQAEQLIHAAITEVLFDIMQLENLTEQILHSKAFPPFFQPVEVEATISKAELLSQTWQNIQPGAYTPNHAPVIKQPEELRLEVSEQLYQTLVRLLDGQRTLRDLSVEMRRDVVDVTLSLLRYVQSGLIELTTVSDLPTLVFRRDPPALPVASSKALIACVDDSPMVRNMMEKLLTSCGYQFLGIDEPLRAIGILLARKPDFIFLDLVMPDVNGYEICEKLRKVSWFRNTPIVILTGSDGYANRLRSNFVGASEFLSKPLNAEMVLSVINKYLQQPAPVSPHGRKG